MFDGGVAYASNDEIEVSSPVGEGAHGSRPSFQGVINFGKTAFGYTIIDQIREWYGEHMDYTQQLEDFNEEIRKCFSKSTIKQHSF